MPFDISDLPEVALGPLNDLHSEEVEMINTIEELVGMLEGDAPVHAEMGAALAQLGEHFEKHFTLEEDNMGKSSYPELGDHKGQHDGMRARYAEIVALWAEEGDEAVDELGEFFRTALPEWFIEHVTEFDTPTAQHVADFMAGPA